MVFHNQTIPLKTGLFFTGAVPFFATGKGPCIGVEQECTVVKEMSLSLGVVGTACPETVLQVMLSGPEQQVPDITCLIMDSVQFNLTDGGTS